jgi:hypothetical protein
VQGDLVLLFGDGGAGVGLVAVGVGDRLAGEGDLVGDGHGGLLVLGDDVLAQAGPAGLDGLGAEAQLLLGAGHRLVGGGSGRVAADDAGFVGAVGASAVGGVAPVAGAVWPPVMPPGGDGPGRFEPDATRPLRPE